MNAGYTFLTQKSAKSDDVAQEILPTLDKKLSELQRKLERQILEQKVSVISPLRRSCIRNMFPFSHVIDKKFILRVSEACYFCILTGCFVPYSAALNIPNFNLFLQQCSYSSYV